ncbi:tetracycline resistance protein Tet (M) [Limosilactobacillus frumenti DSM 13145]|uniref:Tetracycline resistance protein Tet (M) n=1 Tax=Limosilactobacillus frumenti DSM 13145 TaxID=1423746 RepID=A0A0R1PAM4_9LACO|nr:TetM/TetW/TetO/TetS family tetracycline resistance ribosomal protection protein [Limosilactobacillus frumenti]KRL27684.1 tetracycline resistance protein Tet (M) [Limosilactobacillus frumenti DSM 13145]MBA2913893.1 TetM/TetW/TetO/TetS family tetracycline resistance ribosomal protection protein [Limosilactobacillus frumenti]QFG73249.1 TetM/TetW/TetO/TetS family tetracycline resistance ribosomal protection protein [Limosilactobacillus frumenti]
MKKIVTGIVAHVDAGKTTLSEALLYQSGQLRQLGRVDQGSAFLDTDQLEKQRGITIHSHQASIQYGQIQLTLLDTPGHVDFAYQTEQVLAVLDYAILVVSAVDGIQGHTRMLWRLLKAHHVPTFIFINKNDLTGANPQHVIKQLQNEFDGGCLPLDTQPTAAQLESIATLDENVLNQYLTNGKISDSAIRTLIQQQKLFPIYQGAALKLTGVDALMTGLEKWTQERQWSESFGARIFKVSHDTQDNRLTWLRVTGGELPAKATIKQGQKIDQIRVYNGAKFTIKQVLHAGEVAAVTGLTDSKPGEGLGDIQNSFQNILQPVLSYAVDCQENDPHKVLTALRELEDEDPQLHVTWDGHLAQIRLQIMGSVQLEILQQTLQERYHLTVDFTAGETLYKETITGKVEGVGHFEPLRHYAEAHLLLEPAKRGTGLTFANDCSVDVLRKNWQHQIMVSLGSKEHRGVLIGAPLTDVKITLIGGRGKIVHTEGGDFRQATYRAVRQGLMMLKQRGQCQLLEPWYQYRLTVPTDQVGRAINDIQQMSGTFNLQQGTQQDIGVLTGTAPVSEMRDYAQQVRAYSHGQGQLELTVDGYQPCHNANMVIASHHYDPTADLDNTPDSVFCAHGAGYPVKWDQVPAKARFPYQYPVNM